MRTVRRAAATLVAVLAVAGCDGGPDPEPVRQTTKVSPTLTTVAVPASKCPPSYPVPLVLYPETPEEARIVDKLIGCTNNSVGTSTYFENGADAAVWTLDRPATSMSLTPIAQVFRDALPAGLKRRTLEPGQWVIISAAPTLIHLSLNMQVQAAWQALSAFVDTVRDKARAAVEDRLKRLLSDNSKSRKATVACVSEGFNAGERIASAGESRSPEDLIETGLDIFDSVRGCGKAIKEAGIDGLLVADDLGRELKSSTWRSATDAMLQTVKIARGVHF